MKKSIIGIAILILLIGIVVAYFKIIKKDNNTNMNENNSSIEEKNEINTDKNIEKNKEEQINKNSIKYTGWLKTEGRDLLNEHGEKIQLRGISSHGIQWFPDVITYENLKELRENWNINVFRIAMYTDPNANGYISHPEESKEFVRKIVDYAKKLDMYVIIDWHILSDNNPQIYQNDSIKFFDEMSNEYKDIPNVLYEICNEPNGENVKWDENVKPYAEEVIKTIRKNSPKALVIVGTPTWCTDIESAINNPINESNIVYSCHFYAGTHKEDVRAKIDKALEKNIPIFVSECGITDASGNGAIYEDLFNEWINYLNNNNISWVFWSFCNKAESSSILRTEYKSNDEENSNINNYLTRTGEIVKSLLKK